MVALKKRHELGVRSAMYAAVWKLLYRDYKLAARAYKAIQLPSTTGMAAADVAAGAQIENLSPAYTVIFWCFRKRAKSYVWSYV